MSTGSNGKEDAPRPDVRRQDVGALLYALASRLPGGMVDLGHGHMQQAQMFLSYDDGIWEMEWVPLDCTRNCDVRGEDLVDVLTRTLDHDRMAAPGVTDALAQRTPDPGGVSIPRDGVS
jgi:hypothetical protein